MIASRMRNPYLPKAECAQESTHHVTVGHYDGRYVSSKREAGDATESTVPVQRAEHIEAQRRRTRKA